MDYRREIDGLRALAVLPVILFHAGFETFSGGFVGVDVFFVISGYLITTIILAELEQGKFSIVNFYERRARRILPALFLVMLVCIPFAWFWLLPSDMKDFSQSLVAVSVFASNILFWRESGYFDTAAELKPLLHTWSLAVEEQYYVLFPLFLMLFWRLGKRWILFMLGLVFVASLAVAQWGAYAKPAAAFYLLPTRGWELLIGAFAAFYLSKANRKEFGKAFGEVCGWLGIALILYAVFTYSKTTPFPGLYALVPTLGTVLIILFATQNTTVGRFVGNKAFVGVGLISYSAYLWHQPLFAFARQRSLNEPSHTVFLVLSFMALVLAYFSWRYVESVFRRRDAIKRKAIFLFALVFSVFFISLGLVGHLSYPALERQWLSRVPESQRAFFQRFLSSTKRDPGDRSQDLSECRFNITGLNEDFESRIRGCQEKFGSGVLILGDSHAIDLFGAIASRFNDHFLVGVTSGGCRPYTPLPECQYDRVLSYVQQNPRIFKHIIYEQAGFYLLLDSNKKKGTRAMFSNLGYKDQVKDINVDDEHIDGTLKYLEKLSKVVPVTWFSPRIEHHINSRLFLKNGCEYQYSLRPNLHKTFRILESKISESVKDSGNKRIRLVSQIDIFKFDFPADLLNCKDIFWSDGDHFSSSGEAHFGAKLPADFLQFRYD